MTIAQLIVDISANTAKLQTDVNKIHGQLDGISSVAGKVGTMLAGAFTVTAITGAISSVINYADKISNLSLQTGLAKRTLQEMDHVAKVSGTSLDAMTNAAFKLGTNLAGGANSVVGAVEKLGLSWFQLKQQSPDQQFNTIMTALNGVEDAQERNRLAIALFGKVAKDILPAIAQGYDNLKASAIVASDAQIDALDMAGDALDQALAQAKSVGIYLAGGFVIAVREAIGAWKEWSPTLNMVNQGFSEWAAHLQVAGLKSVTLPKVLNESAVAAKNLPPALAPAAMSVAELAAAEKKLTEDVNRKIEANKAAIKAQQEMTRAHQQFVNSVKTDFYTADYYVEFKQAVLEANFALEELASTLPTIAENFVPFKAAVQESSLAVEGWRDTVRNTMTSLPGVIMDAIKGGGSVIGAAGAHIGTSLMSRFQEKFGPAIKAALPFGIGDAINALLPTLGALFGPVAEKIAGFFRRIFGGPSEDELRGRQAVADFEAQLHSTLNATQQLEAGQESWKKTVIAIRDAYMAVGLTEAEALQAAERLWASSRDGAAASQKVIDEIRRIMEGGASAAGQFASNLDHAFRNREMHIGITMDDIPNVDIPGFAGGSGGIRDFGSGTPAILHGRERVQTEAQMRAEQSSGGDLTELRQMIRDLPRTIALAVSDAIVLHGVR